MCSFSLMQDSRIDKAPADPAVQKGPEHTKY